MVLPFSAVISIAASMLGTFPACSGLEHLDYFGFRLVSACRLGSTYSEQVGTIYILFSRNKVTCSVQDNKTRSLIFIPFFFLL